MNYSPYEYPFESRRTMVYGSRGMVATGHPLAASAGLQILQKGGNAVDAAIAMAACLTVVEPCCNGLGGDGFGIIHDGERLYGLNASGKSPQLLNGEEIRAKGYKSMPLHGWTPVNVPGVVGGWMAMWERFGSISIADIMEPAIEYARSGAVVQPQTAINWKEDWELKKHFLSDELFQPFIKLFSINGKPYEAGMVFKSEEMARTLEEIADTKGESFYRGRLAKIIDQHSNKTGGLLRGEDLEAYHPQWVEPISSNYKGYDIWEIPPNGHGISVLIALEIIKELKLSAHRNGLDVHRQIEAMKLAFADVMQYITDSNYMKTSPNELLSSSYIRQRKELIGEKAMVPVAGRPKSAGTVYMAAADKSGKMVSWIQSNYTNFGSGIVVPGTGISLHNRGCNFTLEPGHVNEASGGKKPYHTIIPGFITKENNAVGAFGIMGAFMQPQAHVQVVLNLIEYGLNPQAALDAWRWQWMGGKKVELEPQVPFEIASELMDRGHHVKYSKFRNHMGRGQIILKDGKGIFAGGTEPRTDGAILAF
ncbi:MAG: gamma-glutamyltransferase family protein [Tissierellia bacterium]|nr:gamma-glutamyltransferase family protein [Tissierellia bacterium]